MNSPGLRWLGVQSSAPHTAVMAEAEGIVTPFTAPFSSLGPESQATARDRKVRWYACGVTWLIRLKCVRIWCAVPKPQRVAIRGWSYGGFLAALAVLRRPDVFHAAIAGAPVTDQRLYDTHWRERHLGHPDERPEAYDRCSLIGEAAALSRPLLLVHGLADDNVVAAHTLRLSAALLAAGRPHEVLPLPRATHQAAGTVAESLLLHQLEFLQRTIDLRQSPSAR